MTDIWTEDTGVGNCAKVWLLNNCGCMTVVLAFNLLVGGWSVNYLLDFFLQKTAPFIWAAFIGLIVGEISVPVAVVIAILRWCGIL